MGRPQEFDRDQAVTAAMNLFWREGVKDVTVSDLSHAMGITRSSFYNSFQDKETVFREAMVRYFSLAPDSILAKVEPGTAVRETVTALFHDICRWLSGDPEGRGCLAVNSISELASSGQPIGEDLKEIMPRVAERYAKLLSLAVKQGEIDPPDDLEALALSLAAFQSGLTLLSKSIRDEGRLWAMTRQFLKNTGLYAE